MRRERAAMPKDAGSSYPLSCKFMAVTIVCEKYLPFLSLPWRPTPMLLARPSWWLDLCRDSQPWSNGPPTSTRLCDHTTSVRYNALMVLTHMILNDMVKVKGRVVNSAMLTDLTIRSETFRLFFLKLNEEHQPACTTHGRSN